MKLVISIYIILSSLLMLANCGCSSAKQSAKSTKSITTKLEDSEFDLNKYKTLPIRANNTYTLKSNWDLKGETYVLPEGVTLKSKGGMFQNGTLIGNNTKIDTKKALFNKVSIQGYWNVPEISTNMFTSFDYENSLRDVFALASPEIANEVIVEDGIYTVSAEYFQAALNICSNTTLIINGTIRLIPNDHKGCYILQLNGSENVVIKGSGCLIGDKKTHKGSSGEWGHGINILNSNNVIVQDLHVKNCWGDCIYVGDESSNVSIVNCILVDGRRQGISVTSADGVYISNCLIENIAGTAPECAIDIEPNQNDSVFNIKVENCRAVNCRGGFLCWGGAKGAYIGTVMFDKCTIEGDCKKYPYHFTMVENLTVNECTASLNRIFVEEVNKSILTHNKVGNKTDQSIYIFDDCKPTLLK